MNAFRKLGYMLVAGAAVFMGSRWTSTPGTDLDPGTALAIRGADPYGAGFADDCTWYEAQGGEIPGAFCVGQPDDVIPCITCAGSQYAAFDSASPGFFTSTSQHSCNGIKREGLCKNNVCANMTVVGNCSAMVPEARVQ